MSLGALCGINFIHNDVRLAGQHVCSCALAGVADVSISLHAAHHRMRRYGNMDHGRPTLRADCLGIDCVSKGHRSRQIVRREPILSFGGVIPIN